MSHGVAGYGEGFAAAVWEAALALGHWPALYAPRMLESTDWGRRQRANTLGEAARRALVGPCAAPTEWSQEYGRYEPETPDVFGRMCDYCAVKIFFAVAAPADVPEAAALEALDAVAALHQRMVEQSSAGKRFRFVLGKLNVPVPWVCLAGVCYEDPLLFVLSNEVEMPERVRAIAEAAEEYEVHEAW